jgi:C4-dicarboxylate transporter, DctQ subunit
MKLNENQTLGATGQNSFLHAIDRLNYYSGVMVGGTIYLVLSVVIFVEVAARYIFRQPFTWSLDMSTVLLIAGTMLTFGYALQVKAHVNVDSFITRLSPGKQKVMAVIISVICLIVYIGFVGAAWNTFWYSVKMGGYYSDVQVPMTVVKVFIPLGFIALFLQGVASLIRDIVNLRSIRLPASAK